MKSIRKTLYLKVLQINKMQLPRFHLNYLRHSKDWRNRPKNIIMMLQVVKMNTLDEATTSVVVCFIILPRINSKNTQRHKGFRLSESNITHSLSLTLHKEDNNNWKTVEEVLTIIRKLIIHLTINST